MRLRLALYMVMDEVPAALTVVEEKYEKSPFYSNGRSTRSLKEPFQRAVLVMFIIGEAYPFLDGNGCISRIRMNAERLKANECPIIIPIIIVIIIYLLLRC